MGMRSSRNDEDILKDSSEYLTSFNFKTDIDNKEKIIFTTCKNNNESNNDNNESFNTTISITEELNKSMKMNTTFDNKLDLVRFKFQWIDKNNDPNKEIEVMITGSFLNNWNKCMIMEKNPETNIYEYETLLPKERHTFKYIVNNKWLCSELYPTTQDDSNNTNNYIDLTNYQSEILINDKISEKNNETKVIKKDKIKKRKKIVKITNDGYGLKFPLIKDLNVRAPIVMLHYQSTFLLDNQSNQDVIKKNIYCNGNKSNYSNENNCFKEVFKFPHEKLGHISPNIEDFFSAKNYYRYSITERKKHKFLTIIYYKPN